MSTQLPNVTLSYRGSSSKSSHVKGQLRLHRGAYVQLPFDTTRAKPWEIPESIALAGIIASVQQGKTTPLVVGSSSLLLHGVQGWIANPECRVVPAAAPDKSAHFSIQMRGKVRTRG